jgi:Mn-dependent DtxR family transcriptional regulator
MTFAIPIRRLLALRHEHSDVLLMDYLELATLAREPGFVTTNELCERWKVSQPQVSRRINALAAAELLEITPGGGGYQVHAMRSLEVAA